MYYWAMMNECYVVYHHILIVYGIIILPYDEEVHNTCKFTFQTIKPESNPSGLAENPLSNDMLDLLHTGTF